ncbi:muscle M-line assembly protein unc-89-like [Ruditapes philippinarum]|uniref:muscle M-line assembly protein unc-89-like n=1 Tax=Ruditapes philippinarum TaxID=129788 RepID=UPI00295B20AD|nr:muscle M-line assembly protein unc-89-like [Ruditapes philippinarum]
MRMDDKKAELPFGWIVKQSKTYPDRVYYFNVNSGASSWEFPDLLQHYVSGNANTTAAPVLTATSLVVDAVSPEKFPVSTTSPQQTSQSPDTHNQFKSSLNKHHDTSACNTRDSYKKSSSERETRNIALECPGRNSLKPHTLSQLKCRRSTQAGDDGKMSKLKRGVLDDKFSGQAKSQHQSCSDNKFSGQAKSQYQRSPDKKFSGQAKSQYERSPDKKFSGQAKTQFQPCLDNKFSGKAKSQYQRSPDKKFSGQSKSQCQYSPDKKFSGQVKSQYQPYSVKKVCQYAGTGIKTVTSVQKDLHNDKKEDSAHVSQSYHHYKKPDCSLGNCLQQKVKSNPQTSSKSQQPVTFKSYKPSYTKQNVAKDVSYLDNKKLSPIKYPKKSAGIAKVICSTNKSCAQKNEEYSKSAGKDLRTILNVGKRGHENTKDMNSSRNLTDDIQAVKRRKTGTEIQCPNFDKREEIIDLSDDPQSKIKKKINSQVNKEECSLDTYLYVGEDKRRVVRSCHSRDSVSSLVKKTHATNTETLGKTEPVTNTNTAQCIRKLTPSTRDSNVSRSAPVQHVGEERVPKLPEEGSDFDRNNNAEYKLFIGDKDKLLSIQAWINNLQDRAGSESPSVDSYSQVSLGQVNDSVDSGYVTNTTSKTCSPPEKGWAADVKDADVVSRPVVSMEVDECLVDEKLHGEGVWKLAEREGGAGEGGAVPIGVGGDLPVDEGVALPIEENEEEMMDIDEVLVEVRQQVSGSGKQNASSFVDYTDKFTPMKATSKIITVVVDTNVLISNLGLFETLKDYQLQD